MHSLCVSKVFLYIVCVQDMSVFNVCALCKYMYMCMYAWYMCAWFVYVVLCMHGEGEEGVGLYSVYARNEYRWCVYMIYVHHFCMYSICVWCIYAWWCVCVVYVCKMGVCIVCMQDGLMYSVCALFDMHGVSLHGLCAWNISLCKMTCILMSKVYYVYCYMQCVCACMVYILIPYLCEGYMCSWYMYA